MGRQNSMIIILQRKMAFLARLQVRKLYSHVPICSLASFNNKHHLLSYSTDKCLLNTNLLSDWAIWNWQYLTIWNCKLQFHIAFLCQIMNNNTCRNSNHPKYNPNIWIVIWISQLKKNEWILSICWFTPYMSITLSLVRPKPGTQNFIMWVSQV